jgi:hypothetical protein
MANIVSWTDFNVFDVAKIVKGHVLATVVFYALEHYDLIEKLDISEEKLFNFVSVCSRLLLLGIISSDRLGIIEPDVGQRKGYLALLETSIVHPRHNRVLVLWTSQRGHQTACG